MTHAAGRFVPLVSFGEKTIHFPEGMAPEEIQGVLDKDKRRAEDMARMLGRPEYYPQGGNPLEGFQSAVLATPIVGDIVGLVMDAEMYANEPESRNWFNYLFSAAGILPLIPNPAQMKQAAQKIKAYHGSPHDFDKFSMDAIGTGEGAQAYGHGLYFAESEDVAKGYRDTLAKGLRLDGKAVTRTQFPISSPEAQAISSYRGDIDETIKGLRNTAKQVEDSDHYNNAADWLESNRDRIDGLTGSMYQVEIDATPDELLDWDLPLSEQSEAVKRAALEMAKENPERFGGVQNLIESGNKGGAWDKYKGRDFYESASDVGSNAKQISTTTGFGLDAEGMPSATRTMQDRGIKGIKYKDGFSRGADGGTSNYVIFDDRLISIAKKYGIAIPAAAALLAEQTSENTTDYFKPDSGEQF